MRKIIIYISIAIAMTCLAAPGRAVEDAGTNNPFELGAGSRALAMAGAYVALADDATSLFWNPGGLAQLDQIEVAAMHIDLFFDTPYDYFGVAYPILDWGTFSVGAVRVATDGIVLRDERSQIIGDGEGSLDMREFLVGYSRTLAWDLSAGVAVKIDQQRLLGDFDTGVGMDLGLHYRFPRDLAGKSGFDWSGLTAGLAFQNVLGSQLKLGEATDVLPLNIKAGAAYTYRTRDSLKQKIIASVAWEKSTWRSSILSAGLEYSLYDLVALRGGVSNNAWTVGGGIQYIGILLDYALAGEALGMTHRFTLTYRFGTPVSEQRAMREKLRREAVDKEVDQEAEKRAKAAVEKTRTEMEKAMESAARKHRREKRAMLAKRQRLIDDEKRRQARQRKEAVADEYFKALHYFQGIKDYTAKNYQQALVEFETVEKYDPKYLELPQYLARTRQRLSSKETKAQLMNEKHLALYYQGIDLYIGNEFDKAITVWNRILAEDPNNTLVVRNIDEAKARIAKLKAVNQAVEQEEQNGAGPPSKPGN